MRYGLRKGFGDTVVTTSSGDVLSVSSVTDWLNSNSTLAIGLAVGAVVLLMFAKGRR